jgi:hypothetical protein
MFDFEQTVVKEGNSHDWVYTSLNGKEFPCFMKRNMMGVWCGYVIIHKSNKYSNREKGFRDQDIENLNVHGGITAYNQLGETDNLGQVDLTGSISNYWALGFDCGHVSDVIPRDSPINAIFNMFAPLLDSLPDGSRDGSSKTYKTKDFVIKECQKLAEQLSK